LKLHIKDRIYFPVEILPVMTSIIFQDVKTEIKMDIKDYTDIYSALVVDPRAIRDNLLKKETPDALGKIASMIVEIGPRPDKIAIKIMSRTQVKKEVAEKINLRIQEINTFIKKHNIRATQFQAAFPDLILRCRVNLMKNNAPLQRFVPDEILPIIFQFPGSGPVLPNEFRNSDHYGVFNVALTKALSQNTQEVNWSIINKTLEWSIDVSDIDVEYEIDQEKVKVETPVSGRKEEKSKTKKTKDKS